MFYVIICIALILIYAICHYSTSIIDKNTDEIIDLENQAWNNEKIKDKMHAIVEEQDLAIENLKAGRTEWAFEGFRNVKDEIESLLIEETKKELNTADNDNV